MTHCFSTEKTTYLRSVGKLTLTVIFAHEWTMTIQSDACPLAGPPSHAELGQHSLTTGSTASRRRNSGRNRGIVCYSWKTWFVLMHCSIVMVSQLLLTSHMSNLSWGTTSEGWIVSAQNVGPCIGLANNFRSLRAPILNRDYHNKQTTRSICQACRNWPLGLCLLSWATVHCALTGNKWGQCEASPSWRPGGCPDN